MGTWQGEFAEAVLDRVRHDGGIDGFERQGRSAGWCHRPLRLRGRIEHLDSATGAIETAFDSAELPDGVLLKACENRRSSVCPPCAETYRGDARLLVRSGLAGDKGVPDSVAGRPAVFVTLTAPSFGLVHRAPKSGHGPCRPGSPRSCCEHGKALSCFSHHGADDDRLGEALCESCYRYDHQVLWNCLVTELWRRTTIAVKRELAKCCSLTEKEFSPLVRLSYVKVVEYQSRGAIHVHAVVRVDGPDGPEEEPPAFVRTERLTEAIFRAARTAAVPFPIKLGRRVAPQARWGELLDLSAITSAQDARRVGVYAAKYTVKSTHCSGVLDHRLKLVDLVKLETAGLRRHELCLVRAAWRLGAKRELAHLHLRHHAQNYGYRGVCLTHSRRYSTSFTALRAARHAYRKQQVGNAGDGVIARCSFRYAGRGFVLPGDIVLASSFYESQAEMRRIGWEEVTSLRFAEMATTAAGNDPAGEP